jgi:hypothetical protein
MAKNIVVSNSKILLMTEESNTLSEISILIVYVTICILDSGMYSAVN